MEDNFELIHISKIKCAPLKLTIPDASIQITNSISPCKYIKPNPYPVMHHSGNDKTICYAVPQSSSSSLFVLEPLLHTTVISIALNPTLVNTNLRHILEVDERGKLRPTDIPDLSNMSLLPKPLKCFYEWLIRSSTAENVAQHMEAIEQLLCLKWQRNQEEYYLIEDVHGIEVPSFSDMVKIVSVNSNRVDALTWELETFVNTRDWRDGRTTSLTVTVRNSEIGPKNEVKKRKSIESTMKIVIWNCRGMGKKGFRTIYDHILKSQEPQVVILTESRVPAMIGEAILLRTTKCQIKILEPVGITAGAAFISLSEDVKLRMTTTSKTSCCVEVKL